MKRHPTQTGIENKEIYCENSVEFLGSQSRAITGTKDETVKYHQGSIIFFSDFHCFFWLHSFSTWQNTWLLTVPEFYRTWLRRNCLDSVASKSVITQSSSWVQLLFQGQPFMTIESRVLSCKMIALLVYLVYR